MEKAIRDGPFVGSCWLIISLSNNHDLMYLYVEIKKKNTCMETLESKTSWQRVQWYKTNVCMSSRCFCRSSTEENCLSQLSHTYWVDVVV